MLCKNCEGDKLIELTELSAYPGISSDCKPTSSVGRLFICDNCGLIQKLTDAFWDQQVKAIYDSYDPYYQSGGMEQVVFSKRSGSLITRSEELIHSLTEEINLKRDGRLLDIGTGNGAFLKAFSKQNPSWKLSAMDTCDRHYLTLKSIANFDRLYTDLDQVKFESFNMISLIHVFEHVNNPNHFIKDVIRRLKPGGFLFIQTPNSMENAFDFLIIDHCLHLNPDSLDKFLYQPGLKPVKKNQHWIQKELSNIYIKDSSENTSNNKLVTTKDTPFKRFKEHAAWISELVINAKKKSELEKAIFGTSIGGTWLAAAIENNFDYFIDEDPSRIGTSHIGKPVKAVQDLKNKVRVLFTTMPKVTENIINRNSDVFQKQECIIV